MKIGIIGSGKISDIYLSNLINVFPDTDVRSIASLHYGNAVKKAEKYGIKAVTVDEMLSDPKIDIVVNLTPVGAHYDIIKNALLAGKHVYTEKTITDSSELTRELISIAEDKGLYLCSAPETFLGSAVQTAKEAIEKGEIGEVTSFALSCPRNNDVPLSKFSFLREPGAGVLNDYAVYHMTVINELFGEFARIGAVVKSPYPEHINVDRMSCEYGQKIYNPNESEVSAILIMKNGVMGNIHFNNDTTWDNTYFTIFGTKGILKIPDSNFFGGDVFLVKEKPGEWINEESVILHPVNELTGNMRGIGIADMVDAIKEGRKAKTDCHRAYHIQRVLEKINESGENGRFTDI